MVIGLMSTIGAQSEDWRMKCEVTSTPMLYTSIPNVHTTFIRCRKCECFIHHWLLVVHRNHYYFLNTFYTRNIGILYKKGKGSTSLRPTAQVLHRWNFKLERHCCEMRRWYCEVMQLETYQWAELPNLGNYYCFFVSNHFVILEYINLT